MTTTTRLAVSATLLLAVLFISACSEQADEAEVPDSDAVGDVEISEGPVTGEGFRHRDWTPPDDPNRASFHGVEFDKPATWIETPPVTSLREANYSIPGRRGEQAAELAVLWFAGDFAQPIDVHVERLQSQFEPDEAGNAPQPTVESFDVDGLNVTVIDLYGAYVKPGSAWYAPDTRVITAIIEPADGQLVLRMTGPDATIDANRQRFRAMLESVRAVDEGTSDDPADPADSAENGRNPAD